MINIKKIPLWIKAGSISLSIYLLMNYIISPLSDSIRGSAGGHIIAEIISAPILISMIPLFIFYAVVGFGLDAIFHTGMGYESLSAFPLGVIFVNIFSAIYYFSIGVFVIWIYGKIKK